MKNAWKHLKTIHTHRKWVLYYGTKAGLSFWQCWTHDLSKYSPTEFFESVKYYQGTSSPINASKAANGYSMAWLHHKGRNPHHYEYWQDNFDRGGEALQMPYKYAVELICDYLAAGRAYMGDSFTYRKELSWWYNKRKTCAMHLQTKWFVTYVLEELEKEEMSASIENQSCDAASYVLFPGSLKALWIKASASAIRREGFSNDNYLY